jgi:hypothetical protein
MGKHPKTAVVLVSMACATLIMAQSATQPRPVSPGEVLGPQLIAWSQLQKPQPVPQPTSQPDELAQPREEPGAVDLNQQTPSSPILRGMIVEEGAGYILKASNQIAYRLDDQPGVKNCEGMHVKVIGTVDPDSKSLHIISIELAP